MIYSNPVTNTTQLKACMIASVANTSAVELIKPQGSGSGLKLTNLRGTEASRITSKGLIQVVKGNDAKLDYEYRNISLPNERLYGALQPNPSYLIEPQITNKAVSNPTLHSLTNMTADEIEGANGITDGNLQGIRYSVVSYAVNNPLFENTTTFTSTAGNVIFSGYFRYVNQRYIALNVNNDIVANEPVAVFDLLKGEIAPAQTSNCTPYIKAIGNGWFRCSIAYQNNLAVGIQWKVKFLEDNEYSSLPHNVDPNQSVDVFGLQWERLPIFEQPTSYVENAGTTAGVTRGVDYFYNTGGTPSIMNEVDASNGLLFIESKMTNRTSGTNREIMLSNATATLRASIIFSTTGDIIGKVTGSSGMVFYRSSSAFNCEEWNKIALLWRKNYAELWINGEKQGITDVFVDPVPRSDEFTQFSYRGTSTAFTPYGSHRQLQIYSAYGLSDEDLSALAEKITK